MGAERAVVVRAGEGHRVGNVEFLARSVDTDRFNFAILTIGPRRSGPEEHAHEAEDDSFYVLDGELVFTVDGEEVTAGPARSCSFRPASGTRSPTARDAPARVVNVHAPAGFDRRIGG